MINKPNLYFMCAQSLKFLIYNRQWMAIVFFWVGQFSMHALDGKVTFKNGDPVVNATVKFENLYQSSVSYSATTNSMGEYRLSLKNPSLSGGVKRAVVRIDLTSQKVLVHLVMLKSASLEVTLFDLMGQKLATLVNGSFSAGEHDIIWDYSPIQGYLEDHITFLAIHSDKKYTTSRFLLREVASNSFYSEVIDFSDVGSVDIPVNSYRVTVAGDGFKKHIVQNLDTDGMEHFDMVVDKELWVPFTCLDQFFGRYNGTTYQPFYVKGINLGGGIPGTFPSEMAPTAAQYSEWFSSMAEAGFNLIRIYTLHYPRFYQALKEYNETHPDKVLYLIHGAWLDEEYTGFETNPDLFNSTITYLPDLEEGTTYATEKIMDYFDKRITEVVDVVHGNATLPERYGWASGNYNADVSPWLLGYIIGREIYSLEVVKTNSNADNQEFVSFDGDVFGLESGSPTEIWATMRLDVAMSYEKEKYGEQHPISFSSWPTLDPIEHPTETGPEDLVAVNLDGIDETNAPAGYFASYHVYPYFPDFMVCDPGYRTFTDDTGENSYLGYLTDLKSHYSNRPLIISEYGVSSGWGTSRFSTNGMHHGGLTEEEQGRAIVRMMQNIKDAGCGGGMLFSWIDEWFKYVWIFGQTNDPENRRLWHNVYNAEQNYGLITFIPVEPDFSKYGFRSSSADIYEGRLAYDAEGFYVKVILNRTFTDKDTLWIGIDTYNSGKGESVLPNKRVVQNRAEFCAVVSRNHAQLKVTPAYSMFGIGQEGFPINGQYFRSVPSDAGLWTDVKWKNHRDDSFCAGSIFDAGNLKIRDNQAPVRHDAVIIDNKSVVVKLPWGILNFNDPSRHRVVHITDYSRYGSNYTQTEISDGIAVTLFLKDSKLTIPRYLWPAWNENSMPETRGYKKTSWYMVKRALYDFSETPN